MRRFVFVLLMLHIKYFCDHIEDVQRRVNILEDIGLKETLAEVLDEARLDFGCDLGRICLVVLGKCLNQIFLALLRYVILIERGYQPWD